MNCNSDLERTRNAHFQCSELHIQNENPNTTLGMQLLLVSSSPLAIGYRKRHRVVQKSLWKQSKERLPLGVSKWEADNDIGALQQVWIGWGGWRPWKKARELTSTSCAPLTGRCPDCSPSPESVDGGGEHCALPHRLAASTTSKRPYFKGW